MSQIAKQFLFAIVATLLIGGVVLKSPSIQARTYNEQVCYDMVQGKVAWSRKGDKRWQQANLDKLCAGTNNPNRTVKCFRQGINRHNNWNRAIKECRARKTLDMISPMKQVEQAFSHSEACYNMVQGKVVWARNGSNRWQRANLERLCNGTTNPHATIDCFQRGINYHNDWNRAINECNPQQVVKPQPIQKPQRVVKPQKSLQQVCYDMVQGKVAWSRNGSRSWQPQNVRNLCAKVRNPNRVVDCFRRGIKYHNNWNRAIKECRGL